MEDQTTPRVFDSLWRYRWSSAGIVACIVAVSLAVALVVGGSSTVEARVVLQPPDESGLIGVDTSSEAAFSRYVNQRALLMTSDRVLSLAQEDLERHRPLRELRREVSARESDAGESIVLEVDGANTDEAMELAEAVIDAYRSVAGQELAERVDGALETLAERRQAVEESLPDGQAGSRVEANTSAAAETLSELDRQATELRLASDEIGDGVAFVQATQPEETTLVATLARDGGIGLVLGLIVATAVAWVRADRDRRLHDPSSFAALVDEPVLGEIERLGPEVAFTLTDPKQQPAKPYRLILASVQQAVPRGIVAVTGLPTSGSTTTSLQLAGAAARAGMRVLVIDAALRTRGLSAALLIDGPEHGGLTDLAAGLSDLRGVMRPVNLGYGMGYWAVPAGQFAEGAAEVFRASQLRTIGEQLRSGYDLVLIDCSAPDVEPESTPLLREADRVVVTVRYGTSDDELLRLRGQLEMIGASIAGYVFTFAAPVTRNGRR
ncbi:cell shape-determining protein [Haloechinothrix sp. LS1_15]|uniref:cell shape-determining protein n=1 Tax=Haloechinothrix sp. LS1_15 TaxID=2652248 RepID=UPI002947A507|nr:cell shape-determining protein [Haloechinothrix sp. LS1_15]MDV6013343.1 cell shape-determining protein [Haloechinothrix sp. LS1_15]